MCKRNDEKSMDWRIYMDIVEKAKKFLYRNARPLDIARWNYLFENGDVNEVIKYLSAYQNEDGGFGNSLEPDCWNPNSSPVQTWVATRIIEEIDLQDNKNPVIVGLLNFLSSKKEFDGHCWNGLNAVESNNNFPHASWWEFTKSSEISYNPTASLIGFMLKYAQVNSEAYIMACNLAQEAYESLKRRFPLESMHETACFVEMYDYMKEISMKETGKDVKDMNKAVNLNEFGTLLQKQIESVITYDTSCWSTSYVCKPSLFIKSKKSDFYQLNEEICKFESEFIEKTQLQDGTWNVTWAWDKYPEEWNISKNWWKADIIIRNIKYYNAFK